MSKQGGKTKTPNRLWIARKRRGLGQKQIAFLMGKTIDEVSRYERGVRMPELTALLAIEIVYGAPLRVLFKELYERMSAEIRHRIESQKSFGLTYARLLAESDEGTEYCGYEDILRLPILSQKERDRVRHHVTQVIKKLAEL